jgi:hypothetical protein
MALTKVNRGGLNTGIADSSNATFLTATSAEGVTLAGTLAVTGVHTVGTNAVATSDGGAATTNIVQGLMKCWVQINQSGTQAIQGSFNVTSITDVAGGTTTVTIANDMANNDYSVTTAGNSESTSGGVGIYSGCSVVNTTDCKVSGRRNNALADSSIFGVQIAGDLA